MQRLLDHEVDEIARAFVTARRRAYTFTAFPGRLPECLDDADRIQDRAIALDGRRVAEVTSSPVPTLNHIGPLAALVFLAAARGRNPSAGDNVLTGMTTGIHAGSSGSHHPRGKCRGGYRRSGDRAQAAVTYSIGLPASSAACVF